MATIADLLVKIGADTSDLRKELNATQRQLKNAFGTQGMAISSKSLSILEGIGAGITAIGAASVYAAAKLQTVNTTFENLTGSASKATSMVADLQAFAAKTTIDFTTASEAAKKFLAMGYEADQIIPTLNAVADAAAGVGMSTSQIDKVTTALAKLGSKATLQATDITALTKAGLPAWQMLADEMGVSVPEAMDKVSKGAVEACDGVTMLVNRMETQFAGSMEKQAATLAGAWSTITTGFEQAMGQVGLKIADALDIAPTMQKIGDTMVEFGKTVATSGISEALRTCIPPEFSAAVVAIGTVLTGVAIPAIMMLATKVALLAAPFTAAVAAAAPFIAVATAVATGLYLIWQKGIGIGDIFNAMGISMETVNGFMDSARGLLANLKNAFSNLYEKLEPVVQLIGAGLSAAFSMSLKIIGTWLSQLVSMVTTVVNVVNSIVDGFNWLLDNIGEIFDSIVNIFSDLADRLLPDWAKSCLSTISDFVGKATSSLKGFVKDFLGINDEIKDATQGIAAAVSATETGTSKKTDYSNLRKTSGSYSAPALSDSTSGKDLLAAAQNIDKSLIDEWNKTFGRRSEMIDAWYQDELAVLEKSKSVNANYETDKLKLDELYYNKKLNAAQEEARKEQEIIDSVRNASYSHQEAVITLYGSEGQKQIIKLRQDYESAISSIEKRWQEMSDKYADMTEANKEKYLKALDDQGIAYEKTESGELTFAQNINEEKIAALQSYYKEAEKMERDHQVAKADIQEAYNDLSMENLQTLLTEQYALEESHNQARMELMQTYEEAFMQAHMDTLELIANLNKEALSGLETAFTDILTGSESAKDAFEKLGKSMIKVIANYFSQMVAGMIMASVMGKQQDAAAATETAANAAAAQAVWAPPAWLKLVVSPSAAGVATGLLTSGVTSAAAVGSVASALSGAVGGVTKYASGGLFTHPILGILGEGADDEVALPLNKSVFESIAEGISTEAETSNGGTVNATQNIYGDINNGSDLEEMWNGFTDMLAAGIKGY